MTQNAAVGQRPDVALIAFSVALVADNVEPSMINPDFLRHNGIVGSDLQTEQPPVSTPLFSQVVFQGGLTVTAQPNLFDFSQRGEELTEDVVSADIARRFLEKVPSPHYRAIGINPTGVRPLNDGSVSGIASVLIEGGRWLAFENVSPMVGLKVVYSCQGRRITMDVQDSKKRESDGSESSGLLFAVNIHRDIEGADQEQRIARLMSILSRWKDDLSDFKNMADQFNPERAVL